MDNKKDSGAIHFFLTRQILSDFQCVLKQAKIFISCGPAGKNRRKTAKNDRLLTINHRLSIIAFRFNPWRFYENTQRKNHLAKPHLKNCLSHRRLRAAPSRRRILDHQRISVLKTVFFVGAYSSICNQAQITPEQLSPLIKFLGFLLSLIPTAIYVIALAFLVKLFKHFENL